MSLGVVIDGLLAVLLVATLVYVARLNRRLGHLREARAEFEALIARFTQATQQADRSLAGVREAAAAEGKDLQAAAEQGRGLREDLTFLIEKANGLADRLEAAITRTRKEVQARPQPSAPADKRAAFRRPAAVNDEGDAASTDERDLMRALASVR